MFDVVTRMTASVGLLHEGVGHLLDADVALAVPGHCLHGSSRSCGVTRSVARDVGETRSVPERPPLQKRTRP